MNYSLLNVENEECGRKYLICCVLLHFFLVRGIFTYCQVLTEGTGKEAQENLVKASSQVQVDDVLNIQFTSVSANTRESSFFLLFKI